jgi:hypothetical protein
MRHDSIAEILATNINSDTLLALTSIELSSYRMAAKDPTASSQDEHASLQRLQCSSYQDIHKCHDGMSVGGMGPGTEMIAPRHTKKGDEVGYTG